MKHTLTSASTVACPTGLDTLGEIYDSAALALIPAGGIAYSCCGKGNPRASLAYSTSMCLIKGLLRAVRAAFASSLSYACSNISNVCTWIRKSYSNLVKKDYVKYNN